MNISGEVISTVGTNGITFGPITLTGGTLTGLGGWTASGSDGFQMFNFGNGATTGSITANGSNNSYISLTGTGNSFNGFNLAGNTTISVSGGGGLFISLPLLDVYGGAAGSVTKTGSGFLALGAASAYRGGTTVSGGTLQMGNNTALGASTAPLP